MLRDNPAMDWHALQGGVKILVVNVMLQYLLLLPNAWGSCCLLHSSLVASGSHLPPAPKTMGIGT